MPDIAHWHGGDIGVDARGDILLADGIDLSNQRIVRRLMTNIGEYIWHLDYGASVPSRVGDVLDLDAVTAVILSQMFLEASVSRDPAPEIKVSEILNGVFVSIKYIDALTGRQVSLEFEVDLNG